MILDTITRSDNEETCIPIVQTLYFSKANLEPSGMWSLEYFSVSRPLARELQVVVPSPCGLLKSGTMSISINKKSLESHSSEKIHRGYLTEKNTMAVLSQRTEPTCFHVVPSFPPWPICIYMEWEGMNEVSWNGFQFKVLLILLRMTIFEPELPNRVPLLLSFQVEWINVMSWIGRWSQQLARSVP